MATPGGLEDKKFWQDAPELSELLDGVYRTFLELSGSRQSSGMGAIGRIPFEVADRYAARFGIGDFEDFWALISSMDDVFLRYHSERMRAK